MVKLQRSVAAALVLVLIAFNGAAAVARENISAAPTTKDGVPWRVGYYQGGDSLEYYNSFITLVQGLMDLGWIEQAEIPEHEGYKIDPLWNWLATKAKSKYITFVSDAAYSANWDSKLRRHKRGEIIDRLNGLRDIDFMIVMGTWAGQDLANDKHSVPMTIMTSSDPINSRIIKGEEDSGYDHVHAHLDLRRYERQIRLFHDLVGFRRLGVCYENSVAGRSYAAINLVTMVASERGFEVVHGHTQSDIPDREMAGRSVVECFNSLVGQVDALYVTKQGGVNPKTIPNLVSIANDHHIPTFSQSGSSEVKLGILLSMESGRMTSVGRFHAVVMANVFNGVSPRQLDQVFEARPNIAINLKTAELIGFIPHADMLAGADEIYLEIDQGE